MQGAVQDWCVLSIARRTPALEFLDDDHVAAAAGARMGERFRLTVVAARGRSNP